MRSPHHGTRRDFCIIVFARNFSFPFGRKAASFPHSPTTQPQGRLGIQSRLAQCMNLPLLQTLMTEARDCALAMIGGARRIERELPSLPLGDPLEADLRRLCAKLAATQQDAFAELIEMAGQIKAAKPDAEVLASAERILRWLDDDIAQLKALAKTLEAAGALDPEFRSAQALLAENAIAIEAPLIRAKEAARGLDAATQANGPGE